jgi:solute carrier family 35 protein F1/2
MVFQAIGILICCGGMSILVASDHITVANGGPGNDMIKDDLFGLLGSTLYSVANVFEERLVSKQLMHYILVFKGLFSTIINGVRAAILDRKSFQEAH